MSSFRLFHLFPILVFISACSGSSSSDSNSGDNLPTSQPPFSLENEQTRFIKNIAYGDDELQTYDIFLPDSDEPTALIIYIHGGGFTGGEKEAIYLESRRGEILETLSNGVAFATINYRLLDEIDTEGVIKPLNDTKRALQTIRYHAESYNIDKEQIALYGASAGAGSSLWLGLSDDMADEQGATPDDLIDDESTRVRAVGAIETQGSYDLVKWETVILESVGFSLEIVTLPALAELKLEQRLLSFYGAEDIDSIRNYPDIIDYRARVDLLALMSPDDPELWINNSRIPDGAPLLTDDLVDALFHHPLHAKALMDQADFVGILNVSYIPKMGIEDPSDEQVIPFLIRHILD